MTTNSSHNVNTDEISIISAHENVNPCICMFKAAPSMLLLVKINTSMTLVRIPVLISISVVLIIV